MKYKKCDNCNNDYKRLTYFRGKSLCYKCYKKKAKIMPCVSKNLTIEEALNREYTIRRYLRVKENYAYGYLHLPECLAGKKIKLVLIE